MNAHRLALAAALVSLVQLAVRPVEASTRPGGGLGTIGTIAGPGFCPGDAEPDRESTLVHALAVSADGHVYFDTGPAGEGVVASVDPDGTAQALRPGIRGDEDGEGVGSGAVSPAGRLATDDRGGLFLAGTHRIVRFQVGPATIAGAAGQPAPEGAARGAGDGGPAHEARFTRVRSLAADTTGNVYVAEDVDRAKGRVRIRFLNRGDAAVTFYPGTAEQITVSPGDIDTIAGEPGEPPPRTDAPAAKAVLDGGPPALAVHGNRLYLSWSTTASSLGRAGAGVRLINLGGEPVEAHGVRVAPGAVATVAGGTRAGYGGDGGPARQAAFSRLPGMSVDGAGNLLVADHDNHRIRRIDGAGVVTTVAGTGGIGPAGGGFNGNNQPATQALLKSPFDVKAAAGGLVYVSDRDNQQVRVIDQAGTIRSSAGNGVARSWRCRPGLAARGGPPEPVHPAQPSSLAVDASGGIYVGVPGLGQVKRIDPSGAITTAGPAETAESSGPRSAVPTAQVGDVSALAMGRHGGLYVADREGNRVRLLNPASRPLQAHGVTVPPGSVRVVAGSGAPGSTGDGGRGVDAAVGAPSAVAADADGSLLITPGMRHVDASGTVTTLIPSEKMPFPSCCQPNGLALDEAGNVYFADVYQVWLFNRGATPVTRHGRLIGPGAIERVAGIGRDGFEGDGGPALEAEFNVIGGLAADGRGTLYIGGSAYFDNAVRRVDSQGIITSVAGRGGPRFNGDGGKAELSALNTPLDLAIDPCGNLLISDAGNQRVRRVELAGPCPLGQATPTGLDGGPGPSRAWVVPAVVTASLISATGVLVARRRRPEPRRP